MALLFTGTSTSLAVEISLVLAIAVIALGIGYYLGRRSGKTTHTVESDRELERLRTLLEAAGLRIDDEVAKAHSDTPEASGSWTGLPIEETKRVPIGTIPRWDEMHKRE